MKIRPIEGKIRNSSVFNKEKDSWKHPFRLVLKKTTSNIFFRVQQNNLDRYTPGLLVLSMRHTISTTVGIHIPINKQNRSLKRKLFYFLFRNDRLLWDQEYPKRQLICYSSIVKTIFCETFYSRQDSLLKSLNVRDIHLEFYTE